MSLLGSGSRLPPTLLSVAILATLTPAHADSLEVHVAPELGLPGAEVKAVIAAELGASITEGEADLGTIALSLDEAKQLVIIYRRPDDTVLERVVALPALPADRLALIGFLSGNLVRDQLADLMVANAAAPAPAAPAAPPPPAAPAATTPATPPVALSIAPVTIAASAPAPEAAERTVPFSIGLVPPLSTDRLFAPRVRVRGAVNAVAGASSSIDGMSISGVVDVTGTLRGLQLGGAATVAGDAHGAQIAGAGARARNLVGLQLAGAGSVARDLRGIQVGGAGVVARDTSGLQIGGAAAIARDAHGIQIGGATAISRHVDGLQMAGGAAITGRVEGAQLSAINVTGTLRGLQLGAINVAGRVRGAQIGAINVSDASDGVQIGALNFVRNGRTDVDAWAESSGFVALAVRHGGRYVHNVYAVGWTPEADDTPLLGLGLGVHRDYGGTTLDLDAMAWQTDMFRDGVGLLAQARATLAVDLGPVAAFVAAAYNVSVEDDGDEPPLRTMFARTVGDSMSSVDVALWPSLSAGVRGHLGRAR